MAVADIASGALPEDVHRSQLRRAIIASTVGTTIEWYDFLLYGIVTALAAQRLAILSDAAGLQIASHLGAHL